MIRQAPKSNYERTYIEPGDYVVGITKIKETKDDGSRFTKTFTPQGGTPVTRDALVLVMEIEDALPEDADPDGSAEDTKEYNRHVKAMRAAIGEEVAKLLTDSLHEKAELHKWYLVTLGTKPAYPCVLDDMVGRKLIATIVDNSKYDNDTGELVQKFYIGEIARYRQQPKPKITSAAKPAPARQAAAPTAVADDDDDFEDVPF
jgi:hypothetical protein